MSQMEMFKGKRESIKAVNYSTDADELLLVPIGDVHLRAPTCNIQKFLATVEFVKNTDCVVVLMGDLMEAASRHSVGAGWAEQVASPQAQLDAFVEVLTPIKDKIILTLEGNHEERIWKHSGMKVAKILANMLGVPYGGYSAFLKIKVRDNNYVTYAQHGSSNAWYPHTKLTAAMRTAQHTEADLYLYGHTHELLSLTVPWRYMDMRSRTVKFGKRYFVLTGSFLEYANSYAEKKNMYPVKTGIANVFLSGKKWDIHCST